MCGGKSSRMGVDKYSLLYGNVPLYKPALNTLKKFCNSILISSNKLYPEFKDYNVVPDEIKNIGPIGGLYSCLKKTKSKYNMVLACDMPLVSGKLMNHLLETKDEYDAYVPILNERPEPLYAIYNASILPMLENCIQDGNYSLKHLLEELNVYYFNVSIEVNELKNINSPNELLRNE